MKRRCRFSRQSKYSPDTSDGVPAKEQREDPDIDVDVVVFVVFCFLGACVLYKRKIIEMAKLSHGYFYSCFRKLK